MTAATPTIRRPDRRIGPLSWIRKNLFNTWYNAILTIIALWIIYQVLTGFVGWLLEANWDPVTTSPILYAVGQYPQDELWRIGISLWIVSLMFGLSWALWGNIIRNFAVMIALGFIVIGIVLPFELENVSQAILRFFFFSNVLVLLIGFGLGHTPLGKPKWVLIGWVLSLPIIVVRL